MSEIEKLYANIGVEKEYEYVGHYPKTDENGIILPMVYPPFTAEKQILLIQWLLDKTDLYLHRHKTDFTYSIASGSYAVNKYKDFKESIAEFTNIIWQDLTEVERQQIKAILQ